MRLPSAALIIGLVLAHAGCGNDGGGETEDGASDGSLVTSFLPGKDREPGNDTDAAAQLALCLALFAESAGDDEKPRDPDEMTRLIKEAGTPEDFPFYAAAGQEIMLRLAAESETGAAFERALATLPEDDDALVDAWALHYYAEICPTVIYGGES